MRILFGEITPDEGEVYWNDEPVSFRSPKDALDYGIAMVSQDFGLIETKSRSRVIVSDFKVITQEIDRLGTAFRYPLDTKGQPSVSHHFGFNVLEFSRQLEGAMRLLDGALTGLEEEWDQQASLAYQRQQGV